MAESLPFSHGRRCWTPLSDCSGVKYCLVVPREKQTHRVLHVIPRPGSTYRGQVKWHILSSEKGRSAVQRFVPLAGASMSKVLKLVIFSPVPSAKQSCSSPTPILIKFIGSDYQLAKELSCQVKRKAPAAQTPPAGKTEFLMVALLSGNYLSRLISHMFPDISHLFLCLSHTQVHTHAQAHVSYVL